MWIPPCPQCTMPGEAQMRKWLIRLRQWVVTGSIRLPTGRSSGARGPCVGELRDAHGAFPEAGADFQCTAHGLDELGQRADVHVGLALNLRDGGLLDAQR